MINPYIMAVGDTFEEGMKFVFNQGHKHMGEGLLFGQGMKGLKVGWRGSYGSAAAMLPFGIYAAANASQAKRGHKLSRGVGALAFPMGDLVGGFLGGPIGALAMSFTLSPYLQGKTTEGLQAFAEFGRNHRKLEFGQGWTDTQQAYTMRERAAQEMGRSLLNARQYLGKEAALMHQ